MTPELKKNIMIAVAVIALAGAAWTLWGYFASAGASGVDGRIELTVLCGNEKCNYTAVADVNELTPPASGKAGRTPFNGPGYKCPKCGKETLYVSPFECPKCKTLFLMSKGASGAPEAKCPKCGQIQ